MNKKLTTLETLGVLHDRIGVLHARIQEDQQRLREWEKSYWAIHNEKVELEIKQQGTENHLLREIRNVENMRVMRNWSIAYGIVGVIATFLITYGVMA